MERGKGLQKTKKRIKRSREEDIEDYWKDYVARERKEGPTEGDSRAESYWRGYLRKERKRELRERKDDTESLFADEGED